VVECPIPGVVCFGGQLWSSILERQNPFSAAVVCFNCFLNLKLTKSKKNRKWLERFVVPFVRNVLGNGFVCMCNVVSKHISLIDFLDLRVGDKRVLMLEDCRLFAVSHSQLMGTMR
jgi:hypothetical protein